MHPSVCILLLLPLIAAGDVYFAIEKRSIHPERGVVCLSNDSNQIIAPIYDLADTESMHLRHWLGKPKGWISDWKTSGFIENYEVLSAWDFYRWKEMPQFVTNGDGKVINLPVDLHTASTGGSFSFSLLAKYATVLMTRTELVQRAMPGYVLQFDYYNKTTNSKELRILKCDDARRHEPNNCILVCKEKVSLLENGKRWTHFKLWIKSIGPNNTFEIYKRNFSKISCNDVAINPQYHAIRYIAVKNANHSGILKLHALPFLSPEQGRSPNYLHIKDIQITKETNISLDVVLSVQNTQVKLQALGHGWQDVACKKFGQHTKCKLQISKLNKIKVSLQFENHTNIILIKNSSNHKHKNISLFSVAKDGSWFKGCQTLPSVEWEKKEKIISSSNCHIIAINGFDIACKALEQQTSISCQSLRFCTLPTKSINSSHSDMITTTVSDVSKAQPSIDTFPDKTDDNQAIKNNTCKCWSDQVPYVKDLLWTMLCANLVMFVIVSLRWRPLLKQRQCAAQQEVFKQPRLPEPQQIA